MSTEDVIQRIMIQGDASHATRAFSDLGGALRQTRGDMEQVATSGDKVSLIMGAATRSIVGLGVAVPVIASIAETAARAFGTMERDMQRVQHETQNFNQSAREMATEFHNISSRTGQGVENLAAAFRNLVASTGLSSDQVKHVFADIAVAADLAGVSVETMNKLASVAINNLKVPLSQVGELVLKMGQNMRGATGDFADSLPRITMMLNRVGVDGAKTAEELSKLARTFSELGATGPELEHGCFVRNQLASGFLEPLELRFICMPQHLVGVGVDRIGTR